MGMRRILSEFKLGRLVGLALVVYLAFILTKTVARNYQLKHQVDNLNTQITTLNNQVTDLGYQLSYYQTNSYREKIARGDLGLQAPGESVVIVPPSAQPKPATLAPKTIAAPPKSNFGQWWDFLFGTS